MSSLFSQNKTCQLFRRELEEVLRLPSRLIPPQMQSSEAPSFESVGRSLLVEAHLRGLVVDALVRIAIPARKRDALLVENAFVQAVVTSAMAAAAAAKNASTASPNGSSATGAAARSGREAYLPTHRLGKVVALLPKPGTDAATSVGVPSDWLLAVSLGECTELFPLTCVSEEAFTEGEHQVYVHNATAGVAAKGVHALLSGEQVAALQRRLVELRMALLLVHGVPMPPSTSLTTAPQSPVSEAEMMEQRKKLSDTLVAAAAGAAAPAPLESTSLGSDGNPRKRPRAEEQDGGEMGASLPVDGDGGSHARRDEAQVARLTDTIQRQSAQLQSLRQLLQKKEAGIAALLQQQQQSEQQHAAETDRLRTRVEETARAGERSRRESEEQLRERDAKLQAAGETLRSVAAMAAKYKSVYNVLVTSALGFTAEEAKKKEPDDVIALLKARKSLS